MLVKNNYHQPVLLKEAIDFLRVQPGKKYLDATLGGGGHSREILVRGGQLLALDRDPEAIEHFRCVLKACPPPECLPGGTMSPPRVVLANFVEMDKVAQETGFVPVAGVLFDLGVSSHQLETEARGFSFTAKAPLDMRMDPTLRVTAQDLVNGLNEGELAELFGKLGEEKAARRYARAICRARGLKKIETCEELAGIIWQAALPQERTRRIHPATKVFQALRIAVNDELNALREALPKAVALLEKEGRIVVISFHSLEDGLVKRFFTEKEREGELKIITPKPVVPNQTEIKKNIRARSAKLRVAEKK